MRGCGRLPSRCSVSVMVLLLSVACLALQAAAALAAPAQPVTVSPGGGRVDVTLNPTLEASTYSGSNSHKVTEWQIDDGLEYEEGIEWTYPEWTRTSTTAETGTVVNADNGTFANALAGKTSLNANESYYWRVRYQDSTDAWSEWSDVGFFITGTSTWYLAEGSTEGGMETWVLVMNPGDIDAVVEVEFMTENGAVKPADLQGLTIAPNSRISIDAGIFVTSYDVSTRVVASTGTIVCERAVYGNGRQWGHDSIGVTSPAPTWYLAEGSTEGGMETWVLVQNPNSTPVTVDLDFMTSSGNVPGPRDYGIQANSRVSFSVNNYVTDYNVSTKVTSTGGDVICERAMYGNGRQWGHDSIGATSPESGWVFAEGCTLGEIETWILIQNPMEYAQDVMIFVMYIPGEMPSYLPIHLEANSRVSINLGELVDSLGELIASYNVSASIFSWDPAAVDDSHPYGIPDPDGKVICERAMYDTSRTWGHDSIGSDYINPVWVLPEGSTGGGMETWVLVMNPNEYDGLFDMFFFTDEGVFAGPQDVTIAAFSRVSVNVADYVGSYNVSTWVDGTVTLVCERSMYGDGRTWAHNSAGHMLGVGDVGSISDGPGRRFGTASAGVVDEFSVMDCADSLTDCPRLYREE